MKNLNIAALVFALLIVSSLIWFTLQPANHDSQTNSSCKFSEMNYYFRTTCSHRIRVSRDGSLEKLGELGVNINRFEVVRWGMYGIQATPTFEFGGQRISGYRTFDQLKELLGC